MSKEILVAYDGAGNIVATLESLSIVDEAGTVVGTVDFGATEASGLPLLNVWNAVGAKGSKVLPVDGRVGREIYDYRVVLDGEPGRKRIGGLVHKEGGEKVKPGEKIPRRK